MRHARRCSRRVVKLLIRPAAPTGAGGPGAGDHERTSRSKAQGQSLRGSHSRSPTTAQHHQAAIAILTVTPPGAGRNFGYRTRGALHVDVVVFLEERLQFIVARLPTSFGQLDQPFEVGLSRRTGSEQDQREAV